MTIVYCVFEIDAYNHETGKNDSGKFLVRIFANKHNAEEYKNSHTYQHLWIEEWELR